VQVNVDSPLAVEQLTTIDGFVGDNQLNPLENMSVLLTVENIAIGNATTDSNGNFSFTWQVPNIFADGNNTVIANVPAQGYYRAGQGNTTFFLAHRSEMSVSISESDVTRTDFWEITGSLYDIDTALNDGLAGETISIYLGDEIVATVVTSLSGEFSTSIRAQSSYSRGDHVMRFEFSGSPGHLPTSTNVTVTVWAEVTVQIDEINSYVIRGDSVENRIFIKGRVTEVGGQGAQINNAILLLGNGFDCSSSSSDSRCINNNVIWDNGIFTMTATAPTWMEPGTVRLNVETPQNGSQYLRAGNIFTDNIQIRITAESKVSIDKVIEGEQEVIRGEISLETITQVDPEIIDGVNGVSISVYLENSDGERIDQTVATTKDGGIAEFIFNNETPYGDTSVHGELIVKMSMAPNSILSDDSVDEFNANYNQGVPVDYEYEGENSSIFQSLWFYAILALLVGAVVAFVIMRRRAESAAKEIADIFSYTAELLAAGDSMREAIFQCYESLVHVLMGRGFLRRDFETVREFEMAIRAALPNLSDEALSSLDNVFEEARYSRHEMGEVDKNNAQEALTRVVGEIQQIGDIPNR
tara:strand:- start:3336 stop:5087 length:1752 start_codon:yes stop_codon:yes gene_type:complete